MLNSVSARPKLSSLDKMTSWFVVLIFIFLLCICTALGLVYAIWEARTGDLVEKYITGIDHGFFYCFIVRMLNYMLIFGNFVPISMLLTLEVAKFCQGYIMSIDKGLISFNNMECEVHGSNLNEELGQLDYIFSDKTGTLTRNEMKFKHLVIGSTAYGEKTGYSGNMPKVTNVDFTDPSMWEILSPQSNRPAEEKKKVLKAMNLLSICHTVVVEKDGTYNASSPDELAFVNFGKLLGCEFAGMDEDNNMMVNEYGQRKVYKVLDVIEFNSDRKRMTVIVQDERGTVTIYTKGADNIMIPRYNQSQTNELNQVKVHLDKFAEIGLRTLLLGYRELTPQQYQTFKSEYDVNAPYEGCKDKPRQKKGRNEQSGR
jgi:phospholipid-transporting ATPase